MNQYARQKIIDLVNGADPEEKELMLQELLKGYATKTNRTTSVTLLDTDNHIKYNIISMPYHK